MTKNNILRNPFLNKGTAFTYEEREKYELDGLLPPHVETLDEQIVRVKAIFDALPDALQKNYYLTDLYNKNRTLYFATVQKYVTELLPIIYTPTIGDAVTEYHKHFQNTDDALFINAFRPEILHNSLKNACGQPEKIKMMVITDGEGVLGIGDWGVNGVQIAVGKLAVYTVAAGLDPSSCLPVIIDFGTNNLDLRNDPLYLGERKPRMSKTEYDHFIAQFISAAKEIFKEVVFHFEDFGRANASRILDTYKDEVCTFNDDIQGTGAMVVAAALSTTCVSKIPLAQQRILIFGAGTAGIGIATELCHEIMHSSGVTRHDAKKAFYLVDRNGLVTDDMADLTTGQRSFARDRADFENIDTTSLLELVRLIKPTMLIGSSGVPSAFSEDVVREMASYTIRPAILPLSNPTKLAEAKAADLIQWTNGKALIVTGSPSAPVEFGGQTFEIGQANNALLYPGLGLGAIISRAEKITNGMLRAAAKAVSEQVDATHKGSALLPHVSKLLQTSEKVAYAVAKAAIKDGVARIKTVAEEDVQNAIWTPVYKEV
ncbi:NAD-dependent malic enzyme [Listeria sp. ILCC797]|uniref:NAD-dependent malic enzyme n=1 Tax=Listeria sp. ILCC797 TaxID=1918333 RepID=UPI000B58E00E|nr:NAD-dependent malic enzyme [Listeria sp. ILCC797]